MARAAWFFCWLIVLSLPAAAEIWLHARPSQVELMDLSGPWRSADGPHPGAEAVAYADQSWGERHVPHDFGTRRLNSSEVWLRRQVSLPEAFQTQALWFTCGKTDTATAQIFFDGKPIGSAGDPRTSKLGDFDDWTGFWVPGELTAGTTHLLAVHLVTPDPAFAGFGEQRVWLGPAGPLKLYQERITQAEELLRGGFIPVLFLMALFLIALRPRIESEHERQTTRAALQGNLAAVFYLMAASGIGFEWASAQTRGVLMLVAIPLIALTYVEFAEYLAHRRLTWARRIARLVTLVLVLAVAAELALGVDLPALSDMVELWVLLTLAYLVGTGLWGVFRQSRAGTQGQGSDVVLLAAVASSALAAVGDVLSDLGVVSFPRLVDAAFVDLPFVCGGIVLRNFLQLYGRNHELTLSVQERNAELVTALTQAHEATRLKGEFVAKVSHELRTPLNSIINIPQGLLEDFVVTEGAPRFTGDGASAVKYLEMLNRNGDHLLKVVNQLLDFSKLDAGRMNIQYEDVSVAALVRDAVDIIQHGFAQPRGIRIVTEGDGLHTQLRADGGKLAQVLLNLMSNAVKFSPDQGQVTVAARLLPARNELELSVKDQGIGIALEHHAIIFESFRQVEATATRRFGGTGLGLAIAKQLVELHHGTIGFDSAPGKGSTFYARLPLQPPVSAAASARQEKT